MTDEGRKRKRDRVDSEGDLNTFEWNIANFSQDFPIVRDNETMASPIFVGKSIGMPNSFWQIKMVPKVNRGEVEKHFGLYLEFSKQLNTYNPVVKVKREFSLLDRNQKEVSTIKDETVYEYGPQYVHWGRKEMTSITRLTDPANHYLDDGILRIRIKVWIQNNSEKVTTAKKQNCDNELNKNLSELPSVCSDVDIVVENSNLKAHKNILSSRSPVFAAMFKNELTESLTNTVKIDDFSEKTVKGMLEFIYSGNMEIVEEDFSELLKIAEKYQLEELKLACTKTAVLEISAENAIELLIIGDLYNAPELKYRAMDFISSNKADPMFSRGNRNGDFEKLAKEHPLLVLEMYQNVRKKTAPEVTRFTTNLKN